MTLLDTVAFAAHESRWNDPAYTLCIATTPPNQERLARRQIMRYDMAVFLPECLDDQQRVVEFPTGRVGRVRRQPRALFPGYIFLAIDLAADPVALIGERSVATLMRRDLRLWEAPRELLASLRGIAKAWGGVIGVRNKEGRYSLLESPPEPIDPAAWQNSYAAGQTIEVITEVGRFFGRVERETRDTVTAIVPILGGRVPMTVPKRMINVV